VPPLPGAVNGTSGEGGGIWGMALRTARFRPGGRPGRRRARQTGGLAGLPVLVALGIALSGCGAIETWRSLSGVNKNDPDPRTAPFTGNLADGEAAPYPNLGSFPPLPTRTTNAAERQKLTQSLVADRSALAGESGPTAPRPAPGAKAAPPVPAATLASAAPPSNIPAPAPVAAAPPDKTAPNAAPSGRRSASEPPEPSPQNSSLQMPDVRSVPEPEAAQPPPPPAALPAVPRPAAVAGPPPAAVASAMPQPAPPVPVLAPVAPPPPAAKTEPKRAPAATTVATLDIRAAAAAPVGPDRAEIERVAALYKDNPGTVRVLAYAAAPAGGGDPLDSYHAALDRAQAIAKALAEAGIPVGKIQTEAAPAAGARAAGRVEIQFTP
jgi:hypothetical protein